MDIALLGDAHVGVRNDSKHFHAYFKKFYSEVFFPYLLKHKINTVIQLGDLWDRRKYTNHETITLAHEYLFSKFDEYDIELITLLGNHDIFFKESLSVNASELFLSNYKNIKIINEPSTLNIDGIQFTIIPWICQENYDYCVNYIQNDKSSICLGHFDVSGFKMYKNSITSEHGLSSALFSNYEHVYTGHFHHKSTKGNITYIGTPYEMTWQDYGDQKGFFTYNTNTRKTKFIKNPYSIHHIIEYDDTAETDLSTSEYLSDEFLQQYKNVYVKINVLSKKNPYLYDMFRDKLDAVDPLDVVAYEDQIIEENTDETVVETDDTLTIIYKYIDNVDLLDLDGNVVKELMTGIFSEALEMG